MPNKGNSAKGMSEVAGIGIASLTQYNTVNKVIPAVMAALDSTPKLARA